MKEKGEKLKLSYNENFLDNISTTNFINVRLGGILKIVKNKMKTLEEFKKEIEKIHQNIDVYGEYRGANKPIDCICKVCKHKWSPVPSSLLNGCGCPACVNKEVCNYDYHNSIYYKRPDIIKHILHIENCFEYTAGCGKEIDFVCRHCFQVKTKVINDVSRQGFSCSRCGDGVSYP